MTAIDFSALVEQGADAWNQWRAEHPTVRPDLSRAYLYGYVLSGFDLSNTNLERACLIGANLQDANLSGACLQSAYASDSTLSGATLTGANLQQGNFRGADFSGADLSAAGVEGTEFAGANFTGSCLAALRSDATTSFSEAQGEYVYLNLPPAERYPLVGSCQPGAIAQFLQQRFSAGGAAASGHISPQTTLTRVKQNGRVGTALVLRGRHFQHQLGKYLQITYRRRQLQIAIVQLWALIKIQRRKLKSQLRPLTRRAYHYLQTDVLAACNLRDANSLSHRTLKSCRRSCQYGYIRASRRQQALLRQGKAFTRLWLTNLSVAWAEFILGNRPSQRWLAVAHQHIQAVFVLASRWLQDEAFRQSKHLYAAGLVVEAQLRNTSTHTAKSLVRLHARQWRSIKARRLELSLAWTEFVQGNGRFQRQLALGPKRLRMVFARSSRWSQAKAFRLSAHLYAAGLVVEAYLRRVIKQSIKYLNRSKYVQLVLADLKREYRRSSVPITLGAAIAVIAVIIYPFTRVSTRSERELRAAPGEVMSSPISEEIAAGSPSSVASPSTDLRETDLRETETSTAIAATPLSATSNPTATPGIDMTSLSLPCSVSSPTNVETSTGYQYQDGSMYYGKIVDGQPANGEGTMTYPTGNRYTGSYQQGRREGCGTFYFSDGRRYVGQFKADKFDGLGTWILKNDERYIGEFEDNQCSGQGSFIFANGSVKSGTWEEGKLVGTSISCEWGSLQVPRSTDN